MSDIDALYKRGEEAFQKRNYDYARDLFINIMTIDPNHEKARESLYATILQKNKETGGAGRIKLTLMHGKVNMELAAAKNNPGKKIDIAQKYLCDDPTNAKVRVAAAEALKSLGHWGGTAAEAKLALNADPKNLPAAKLLVEALVKLDRTAEAQKHLEKIQIFAHDDRDLMKLQRDLAARQTMSKGFEDAAGKDGFRGALKDADKSAELEKRHHLITTEADLMNLVDDYKKQLDATPMDAKIPKKIGDLFFEKKKDFTEAREWYKKASQLAPQDSVMRDKVDDCTFKIMDDQVDQATKAADPRLSELKSNRLKFIITSFERRVGDRPTDMILRFDLGKAYYTAGPAFTDKAIAEFQQSVRDPKKKRDSHIYLGMAFQRKKMFEMAEAQYIKAEDDASGGVLTQSTLLSIWYNRAVCSAEAGKVEPAILLGHKIMEQDISFRDISALVDKWTALKK